jgi:transcriptional regulator with XRE-family HTH domain
MTHEEINNLYMKKRKKKLSNKSIADAVGCSPSLISHFFNFQCNLSPEKEMKLKQIINQAKEYRWMKVEV